MKKTPAIPKIIEKIELLAHEVAEDDDKYRLLYEEIQKLVDKGKIPLDSLIGYMMENTEDVDALLAVKEACEEVTSEIYFHSDPNKVYQASLFIIPMMYIQPADFQITQLNGSSSEFDKLTKSLKKSGLFSKHSMFYLDNHLYHPEELLNLSFDSVLKMNKAMMNKLTGIEGEDFKFNLVPEVRPENGNSTFTLKYMVGVKVTPEAMLDIDNAQFTEENFDKYLGMAQPLLQKMLKAEDLTVLAVDSFFDGLEFGINTYLSNSRKIKIDQQLQMNGIHPHGAKAIISIPRESSEESTIELVSKLTGEAFSSFEFEIINCRDPEALMDFVASDLEDCGFKTEDVYIRMDDKLVPFVTMLHNPTEIEKELVDFDVEVSPEAFVVPTGKKRMLH